jgi:hypothetical protein
MSEVETVWMVGPFGVGEPVEVEAKPEILIPMMVVGYSQCEAPETSEGGEKS